MSGNLFNHVRFTQSILLDLVLSVTYSSGLTMGFTLVQYFVYDDFCRNFFGDLYAVVVDISTWLRQRAMTLLTQ